MIETSKDPLDDLLAESSDPLDELLAEGEMPVSDSWDYVLQSGGEMRKLVPLPQLPAYDKLLSTVDNPKEFEAKMLAGSYLAHIFRMPDSHAYNMQDALSRTLFREPMKPVAVVSQALQDEKMIGRAIASWNSMLYWQKLDDPPSWWKQRWNAILRGTAGTASSLLDTTSAIQANLAKGAPMYGPTYQTPEQLKAESKKSEEQARVLWQVVRDPDLSKTNGDSLGKLADLALENMPYMATTMGAFTLGGPAAAFYVGGSAGYGTIYQDALSKKVPEDRARRLAAGAFLVQGAIESFGGPASDKLMSIALDKMTNRVVRGGLDLTAGSLVEFLQESSEEVDTILRKRTYGDVDWNDALRAGAGGLLLGGMFNTTSAVMRGITNFSASPAKARHQLRFLAAQGELSEKVVADLEQTVKKQEAQRAAEEKPETPAGPIEAGPVAEAAAVAGSLAETAEGTPAPQVTAAVGAKQPWEMTREEFHSTRNLHGSFADPRLGRASHGDQGGFFTTESEIHAQWYAQSETRNAKPGGGNIYAAEPPKNPVDLRDITEWETVVARFEQEVANLEEAGAPYSGLFSKRVGALRDAYNVGADTREILSKAYDAALAHAKTQGLDEIDVSFFNKVIKSLGHDAWITTESIPNGTDTRFKTTVYVDRPGLVSHKEIVQQAHADGKPVPRHVLEEYASEQWAQEALSKLGPEGQAVTPSGAGAAAVTPAAPARPAEASSGQGQLRPVEEAKRPLPEMVGKQPPFPAKIGPPAAVPAGKLPGGRQAGSTMLFDPEEWADLVQTGRFHLEAGAREFGAWSQVMVQEVGESIRPQLDNLWHTVKIGTMADQQGEGREEQQPPTPAPRPGGTSKFQPKLGAIRYVRFGKPPESGRSFNPRDNITEEGVSVYKVQLTEKGWEVIADGRTLGTVASVSDRDLYFVKGEQIGVGSDGEPILKVSSYRRARADEAVAFPWGKKNNRPKLKGRGLLLYDAQFWGFVPADPENPPDGIQLVDEKGEVVYHAYLSKGKRGQVEYVDITRPSQVPRRGELTARNPWYYDQPSGWKKVADRHGNAIREESFESSPRGESAGPTTPPQPEAATAQPPFPAEIGPPAAPGATVEGDTGKPGLRSARQEWLNRHRRKLGLDGINSKTRRSWSEALDQAWQQKVPENALRLAGETLAKPRALSDVETAGLLIRSVELENEHADLMTKIGPERDATVTSDLSARSATVEAEYDTITKALFVSGSEKGRALASQKLTINENFSLVAVKARAKAAKGGELSAKEVARIEELTAKLADQTAKVETLEKELNKLRAEAMLKRLKGAQRLAAMTAEQKAADVQAKMDKVRALMKAGCY